MVKYQVVLVDDDVDILEIYESYFKSSGYDIKTFHDANVALEYICLNESKIIKVFSDFKMPSMTGLQLREALLSKDIHIPFSIITGFYDKEMAAKAMELKVAKFLSKPAVKSDMLEILEREGKSRILDLEEDRELVLQFLKETYPMLEEMEDIVIHLEEHGYSDRSVDAYLRVLHTVKGTAACLKLHDISTFSHYYEEFVGKIKLRKIELSNHVFDTLLEGIDCLRELYSLIEESEEVPYRIDNLVKIFDGSTSSGDSIVRNTGSFQVGGRSGELTVPQDVIDNLWSVTGDITVLKTNLENNIIKLQKSVINNTVRSLHDDILKLSRVSSVVQKEITDIRSATMHSVFRYVLRAANSAAKSCGKNVEVVTTGGNTIVDIIVSKLFRSALVHLVRNSVDHGIEDEETRVSNGKSKTGKIEINCYEESGRIVVDILDDGSGMDVDAIKAKALERQMYTEEELNAMSDRKIMNIVFESGFSTNESVSDISGRGIGMDMVKKSARELGGNVYVKSTIGKGSHISIHIPTSDSVVITKSLVASVSGALVGVLLEHVVEVLFYDSEMVSSGINKTKVLNYRGNLINLLDLRVVCGLESDQDNSQEGLQDRKIIILRSDRYCYGVIVDSARKIEDIVLKEINSLDNISPFFLGAAVAVDEEIILILDVELVGEKLKLKSIHYEDMNKDSPLVKTTSDYRQYVLFSIEAPGNYAIPVHVVHRLEHVSRECIEYSGDRALLRYDGHPLPIISVEQILNFNDLTDIKDYICDLDVLNVIVVSEQGKMFGLLVKDMTEVKVQENQIDTNDSNPNGIVGITSIEGNLISIVDTGVILQELVDKSYTLNAS